MSGIVDQLSTYQRWRMRPNLDVRWNDTRFQTNRLGFRGPEIAVPKPPKTFRVVILGSSNTLGHGVDKRRGLHAPDRTRPRSLVGGRYLFRGGQPRGLGRLPHPAPLATPDGSRAARTGLDSRRRDRARLFAGRATSSLGRGESDRDPVRFRARRVARSGCVPLGRPLSVPRQARARLRHDHGSNLRGMGGVREEAQRPVHGRLASSGRRQGQESQHRPARSRDWRESTGSTVSTSRTPSTTWRSTSTESPPGIHIPMRVVIG